MALLVFNKWSLENVSVADAGLQAYIALSPRIVPKTGAKYAGKRFHKSRVFIVERLLNKLMVPGHKSKKHFRTSGRSCGKAVTAYNIMKKALMLVEERTKENPVRVLVKAVENAAPREEIVNIEYGGARYPKAVDCAPQRRIDIALRYFVQGAYDKCFNKKKSVVEALAEEIVYAFKLDSRSLAIQKKLEIERQADGSR